jgi:hypothetical protein
MPRKSTPELKERRVNVFKDLLKSYQTEGGAFLQRVVTGDESWAHYSQPEKERASEQRVATSEFTETQKFSCTTFGV